MTHYGDETTPDNSHSSSDSEETSRGVPSADDTRASAEGGTPNSDLRPSPEGDREAPPDESAGATDDDYPEAADTPTLPAETAIPEPQGEPRPPVTRFFPFAPEPEPDPADTSVLPAAEPSVDEGFRYGAAPLPLTPYAPGGAAAGVDYPPRPSVVSRDRLWPHLIWELLLALVAVGVALWLYHNDHDAFRGTALKQLLMTAAVYGGLAVALSWSIRAGVPNLAVGGAAVVSALTAGWLIQQRSWSLSSATTVVLLGALGVGLVLGIFVVAFQVPAWAASLGLALVGLALASRLSLPETVLVGANLPRLINSAPLVAAGVAVASIVGGVFWAFHGVRSSLSATRGAGDPSERPVTAGAFSALFALTGSMLIAAGVGLLSLLFLHGATLAAVGAPTGVPLAIVLVGGVSIYGRRGGFFGTILAAAIAAMMLQMNYWYTAEGLLFLIGGGILAGLIVSRCVEAANRRTPEPDLSNIHPPNG